MTARRWSPARRSATAGRGCIWRSASCRPCTSATRPAAASACSRRCRTACSICPASSCAISSGSRARKSWRSTRSIPNGHFGEAVPRAGNASGGGQPGWIVKCKGWETDPNAYIYFITQAPVWKAICTVIGREEWLTDPRYATPKARLPHLMDIFGQIEEWTKTKTKFEAMDIVQRARHSVRPDPLDEGDRRGAVAARHRHDRRSRSPDARPLPHGRQSDQDVRQPDRRARARRCSASTPTRSWPRSATARIRSRRSG